MTQIIRQETIKKTWGRYTSSSGLKTVEKDERPTYSSGFKTTDDDV